MTDEHAGRGRPQEDDPTYVVAQVRGERIEVPESVLDELADLAGADGMTSEAWVERNLGPSILYGAVVQLVDSFDTDGEVPPATQVATWRAELARSREAAEEVWDDPTLDYAEQVWEAAARLEALLETIETSVTALESARARHGPDHELVADLAANVDQQAAILQRIANALTE